MAVITLKSKDKLPPTVLVDDDMLEELSKYTWTWSSGYAVTRLKRDDGSAYYVLMHRLLVKAKPGELVDHINRNRLDNRRSNLRLVGPIENGWNRGKRSDYTTSSYIGVSQYHLDSERWQSSIVVRGTALNLGVYDGEEEAAYIRDQFAIQLQGEYAVLNFEY